MLGAIAGDVVGSVYEGAPVKTKRFPLLSARSTFTDDSVLTVAVADALLAHGDYAAAFQRWFRAYPDRGFGASFAAWAASAAAGPYGSWGNGSAMRVSPVAWARDTLDAVLAEARASAVVTHDHPEGVRGAEATAAAVFLARTGADKPAIRAGIESRFGYDLGRRLDEVRPGYGFDVSCQGSVPESLIAFLEASDWEDAVRNAISLGGDADTMACIAGAVAEAFFGGVPGALAGEVRARLAPPLLATVDAFRARYPAS